MGFEKLIDLFVQFLEFFRFCTTIDCYERGIRLRLGENPKTLEPGFHLQWPFYIDRVITENVVPKLYQLATQSIMTKDGVTISAGAVICYQIRSIEKAILEVESVQHAVADSCQATLAEEILSSTWDEVRWPGYSSRLLASCRKLAWKYGVEIMSVRFCELAPVRNYRTITGQ